MRTSESFVAFARHFRFRLLSNDLLNEVRQLAAATPAQVVADLGQQEDVETHGELPAVVAENPYHVAERFVGVLAPTSVGGQEALEEGLDGEDGEATQPVLGGNALVIGWNDGLRLARIGDAAEAQVVLHGDYGVDEDGRGEFCPVVVDGGPGRVDEDVQPVGARLVLGNEDAGRGVRHRVDSSRNKGSMLFSGRNRAMAVERFSVLLTRRGSQETA